MKFGREFEEALTNQEFPEQWLGSAIDYKYLKKCIKKVHLELQELGLDAATLQHLNEWTSGPTKAPSRDPRHDFFSAVEPTLTSIREEFCPQIRVLVDNDGTPLDATLAPETKAALQKLARHEMVAAGRRENLGVRRPSAQQHPLTTDENTPERNASVTSIPGTSTEARWVQVPLASAQHFFSLLAPKLEELEALKEAEIRKLEQEILDLGDAVEDVIEPVREGFEARREVSYRDLYFWREMFRLYMEKPVFYSDTEMNRGALTFKDARARLEAYDQELRMTGLLAKMKTPQAKRAAQKFLDLNLDILKIMHFQEVNARAMGKILKKFDKRTHLEGQEFVRDLQYKYPDLMPTKATKRIANGGFANSIAKDLHAEMASKVLGIIPQLDDWSCPVCLSMAWRPVSLGCCRSVFCIRCVIKLQDEDMKRCPCCNQETVMEADGRNINFEAMDFLEKYFPLEVKKRQKENERAQLVRDYGEEFVKPGCSVM